MKKFNHAVVTVALCLFSFTSIANPFNAETMVVKGVQWMAHNQSVKPVRLNPAENITYNEDELIIKVLDILREEKASGDRAYNILKTLIEEKFLYARENSTLITDVIDELEMTAAQKFTLSWLLKAKQQTPKAIQPLKLTGQDPVSIPNVIRDIREIVVKLNLPAKIEGHLTGALDTVKKVLLDSIPEDDCYNTSAGCQFGSNRGLIFYYSRRIHENHNLALAVLKAGMRIRQLNIQHANLLANPPLFNQKFNVNLWPMFLEVSSGDPALAMQVMSVFGHDVMNNALAVRAENKFLTNALNVYRYSAYGGDSNPASVMFLPGVLNGIVPRNKVIKKVEKALKFYNKVFNKNISLRNGYHHIHGGMLMAQELLAAGHGEIGRIDQASFISEVMGYAYKKLQLTQYLTADSKVLWKLIKENEFNFKLIRIPIGWQPVRFKKAQALLGFHLAILEYTEEQHWIGARFAVQMYQAH